MTVARQGAKAMLAGLCLLALAEVASAQSLADLARRTSTRPAAPAKKVITNADLPDVEPRSAASPQGAPAASPSDPAGQTQATDGTSADAAASAAPELTEPPVKAREKRGEEYWRARARDLRGRLDRVTSDARTMADRRNAIDGGDQSPAALQERALIEKQLTRLRADEVALRSEIAAFEARARSENVPPAWLH